MTAPSPTLNLVRNTRDQMRISLTERDPLPAARTLDDVLHHLAHLSGGWLLIEREGTILAHAPGAGTCPQAAVAALLQRRIEPLREHLHWSQRRTDHGMLDGTAVHVACLTPSTRGWLLGAERPVSLEPLRDVLPPDPPAVQDGLIAHMLRTGAPATPSPSARLLVLRSAHPSQLARELVAALANTGARVHQHEDLVVVALHPGAAVDPVLRALRPGRSDGIGVADVPAGSTDWRTTFRLATAASRLAHERGLVIADVTQADTAAELVLKAASEAAVALAQDLHYPPFAKLRDHDQRTGGSLLKSVATWCRHGGDATATAAALHVHLNTLRYRLRRAAEIAGLDLSCPRQVLALQILAHAKDTDSTAATPVAG